MSDRIVIVGGGLAAHRAAHTLRRQEFDGELIVIAEERHQPYDRPPLYKTMLAGAIERPALTLPGPAIDCDWQLGRAATGLDLGAGVVWAGDTAVSYDKLLIATGRRARAWPDLPALDGFHTLRTVDDCEALAAAISPQSRVVIVGAGFIGCEVAATLRGLGVEQVTIVELAAHPMPVTGPEVGSRAVTLHERHGVQLRLSASVASFDGNADGGVAAVRLADGERIDADVVLLALGAVPNTEWLQESGLQFERGAVICDEHCLALGAENVAVAGDMAAFPYPGVETPVSVEHWATAREMGAIAAANLLLEAGERQRFASVPTFWSDQYDVKIKSFGLLSLADRHVVVDDVPEESALIVEAYRGDGLVGVIGFNRMRQLLGYQDTLKAEPAAS